MLLLLSCAIFLAGIRVNGYVFDENGEGIEEPLSSWDPRYT